MPLERLLAKIPKKAQLLKMSREERADAELTLAAEIGVHHRGGAASGANFRTVRTTYRESGLLLNLADAQNRRADDGDVQPDSLMIGSPLSIKAMPTLSQAALEKQVLAHAEKMGDKSFDTLARQLLPQLNALAAIGKQSKRMKAVQDALSKRAFGVKALAEMKRKKLGATQD